MLSGGQKPRFFIKMRRKKKGAFFLNFSRSSRARAGPTLSSRARAGPIWAHISDCWSNFAHFGFKTDFLKKFPQELNFGPKACEIGRKVGPYGSIWARPWPLKSGKSSKRTLLFLSNTFSQNSKFLTSSQHFLMEKQCSAGFWPKYV